MTDFASSGRAPGNSQLATVVITCFNQAHFLREAIESALRQSYRDLEIVLVDDGSTDNTSQVAAAYSSVCYVHQDNCGLSAARNAGFKQSNGQYLVFLDADDRLLTNAVEAGVQHLRAHPDCAFVAGHYSVIGSNGDLKLQAGRAPMGQDPYAELLRGNYIGMHATVMYRRAIFDRVGSFDTSLKACEDYDLYLRIARVQRFFCYDMVVAEYRHHSGAMSRNRPLMLSASLHVLRSQRKYLSNTEQAQAFKSGVRFWQTIYGDRLIRDMSADSTGQWRTNFRNMPVLLRYHPRGFARVAPLLSVGMLVGGCRSLFRIARRMAARTAAIVGVPSIWRASRYTSGQPPVGRVRFGDLRRCTPVSNRFGFDRGLPVDRYYIERFLSTYEEDIQGRVLEIGDDAYTKQFGKQRVTIAEIFDVSDKNAKATYVGDLANGVSLPSNMFDCIILTQTLQLIYEPRAALKTLYRILKPGGILLATLPGISQIIRDTWRKYWCWSFTEVSARRLFEEVFPPENVSVNVSGNVLAAAAFLYGLAAEELQQKELDFNDPEYELLIAVRATKPLEATASHPAGADPSSQDSTVPVQP